MATAKFGPKKEYTYNIDSNGNPYGAPIVDNTQNQNTSSTNEHSPGDRWYAKDGVNILTMQNDGKVFSTIINVLPAGEHPERAGTDYLNNSEDYNKSGDTPYITNPDGTTSVNPNFQEDYSKSGDTPYSTYNYEKRNESREKNTLSQVKGVFKAMADTNIINPNFVKTIENDPSLVAFYTMSIEYGQYKVGDMVNDMKRRELVSQGNAQAKTLRIIDPTLRKPAYRQSAEGQKSVSETASMIPTFNFQGLFNPEILNWGSNMPEELFNILVPAKDPNSKEFKDAVEKVKATYYDLASAQLQATSEQEKSVADYNYSKFKEQTNINYGIKLSDDATKAWTQIESLADSFNQRNIQGSGLHNEAVDNTLATTRKTDQRSRQSKLTEEEAKMASVYSSSATPAQIKQLIAEDTAKGLPQSEWRATKWGLIPSNDIKQKYSLAGLRAQYPKKTDKEIQVMHDAILDENENYRSSIYSKYYGGIAANDVINIDNAKAQVRADATEKEDKAYTDALGDLTGADPLKPITPIVPASTDNGLKEAKKVAGTMGTESSVKPPVQTPSVPQNTNVKAPDDPVKPISTPAFIGPVQKPVSTGSNITQKSTADIQKSLRIKSDGVYGPKTTAAVKAYQTANGLVSDGIVGPKTLAKMFPS